MPNVKNTILDALLAVVAPHLCSGCGKIGSTFCDNCKYDITHQSFLSCILCGKHELNGVCDDHNSAFNQAWVVGVREGALQRLIGGFKFRNMKAASNDLADLLDQTLPALPDNCVLVPIPTSPAHIRERGYDHTLLIAARLAQIRTLSVTRLLKRVNMATQHHADRAQRLEQAATAYQIRGVVDSTKVYLLIDDIVTTGATIEQASLVLKRAGATVWVAVIAKQPLD